MIQIEHLSVAYQQTLALEDLSLTIQGPTILGILGPNGAGKSTLIKAMLGLLPHSGKVLLDQQDLGQVLQRVAYVEQKTAIDFHFPITVRECVSLGLYPHLSIFKRKSKEDLQKVEDALKLVNLLDLADRQIGQLSGGQFQRVLIARCLVQEADVIFLDEPFAGIDSVSEDIIMQTPSRRSRRSPPRARPAAVIRPEKHRPSPCPHRKRWNRLHPLFIMRLPPSGVPFRMLLRSRTTRPDDLKCPPHKLRTLSRKYYFICKTGNNCGRFLFCFFTRKSVPINCIKMPPAS